MSRLTMPSVQRYAGRVGADVVTFGEGEYPEFTLANKLRLGGLFDHYDRVLYAWTQT